MILQFAASYIVTPIYLLASTHKVRADAKRPEVSPILKGVTSSL